MNIYDGEAPVVQLLVLHRQELRWIRRLQPKRIETEVARLEIGTNAPHHAAYFGISFARLSTLKIAKIITFQPQTAPSRLHNVGR